MGYAAGYLMPTLLYYRDFRSKPESPRAPSQPSYALRTAFIPVVSDTTVQVRMIGMF